MTGRSVFGAGVRTVGVYSLAQAIYDLIMVLMKLASVDTGSSALLQASLIALVFRLTVGFGLLTGAPLIVIAVYGRIAGPTAD